MSWPVPFLMMPPAPLMPAALLSKLKEPAPSKVSELPFRLMTLPMLILP